MQNGSHAEPNHSSCVRCGKAQNQHLPKEVLKKLCPKKCYLEQDLIIIFRTNSESATSLESHKFHQPKKNSEIFYSELGNKTIKTNPRLMFLLLLFNLFSLSVCLTYL